MKIEEIFKNCSVLKYMKSVSALTELYPDQHKTNFLVHSQSYLHCKHSYAPSVFQRVQ